jgi:uncharacterized membrane protein
MLESLPHDFTFETAFPVAFIFLMWGLYGPLLTIFGHGTLNSQLHSVREQWMAMVLKTPREHRTFDAVMLGHVSNSMTFFGSATLLILAALLGSMVNIGNLYKAAMDVTFMPRMSIGMFAFYFGTLTVITAVCFFAFTYALRKLAYALAMIGALRDAPGHDPASQVMIKQTAIVMTEAIKSLNTGIRGYYFAVAGVFLFAGPMISIMATATLSVILFYRQRFSLTSKAIAAYVEAVKKVGPGN